LLSSPNLSQCPPAFLTVLSGFKNGGERIRISNPDEEPQKAWPALEKYVKAVVGKFKDDKRVLVWDLYNWGLVAGKQQMYLPIIERSLEPGK